MKKILLSMSLVLILTLVGCGTGKDNLDDKEVSEPGNGETTIDNDSGKENENSENMDTESDGEDSDESNDSTDATSVSEGLTLTVEDLAQYNGKDGNPAYVAVDGVIYDVTDVPQWNKGSHNGQLAGNDLSDEIENLSPHGKKVLEKLPVVGSIVE